MPALEAFEFDDREFQAVCGEVIARGSRLRPMLAEAGFGLLRSTQARFDTETDPDGIPWAALKPETLAHKRTDKKLREGGYLYGGLGTEAFDDYVDVFADREYAAIHQFGGTAEMALGPAAVPARPFMGFSKEDAELVLRIARDYISEPFDG
jgi:phage virion morphogenesis protein